MGPGTVCCDTKGFLSLSTILALINEFYIKWCPINHNRLATPLQIDNYSLSAVLAAQLAAVTSYILQGVNMKPYSVNRQGVTN